MRLPWHVTRGSNPRRPSHLQRRSATANEIEINHRGRKGLAKKTTNRWIIWIWARIRQNTIYMISRGREFIDENTSISSAKNNLESNNGNWRWGTDRQQMISELFLVVAGEQHPLEFYTAELLSWRAVLFSLGAQEFISRNSPKSFLPCYNRNSICLDCSHGSSINRRHNFCHCPSKHTLVI